jgi:Fe-S-cluster containining protein
MEPDQLTDAVASALLAAGEPGARFERLEVSFEQLLTILEGKGLITDGHRRLIAKVAERAARLSAPKVRLRQYVDKYAVPSADIDCAALLPLCHGRCCALSFDLSAQDLDEGVVRWELEAPYRIRHERDGYCTHLDRAGGGCAIYAQRPAPCRGFDCREDRRVWLDFAARVPAPMPEGLAPPVVA